MKLFIRVLGLAFLLVPAITAAPQQHDKDAAAPPPWAYATIPPGVTAPPDDGSTHRIPGSDKALTRTQILDAFNAVDWHPEEHPAMPDIIEYGKKPGVRACGYCHQPNGLGRPESASLAGLSAAYIEQQVADFKNGTRRSSKPEIGPQTAMSSIGEAVAETDARTAAEYFSALKLTPWIRVVETTTVPKTTVVGFMLMPVEGAGKEPIGDRIIEVPKDGERTELRDPASGFIAYAPVGSVKKGEALVTTGGAGKTLRCAICHGADLRGLGPVPALAGRSPSYIFRQLFDLQHGSRHGLWSELMKGPVAKLSQDDMVSIAAYLASRKP